MFKEITRIVAATPPSNRANEGQALRLAKKLWRLRCPASRRAGAVLAPPSLSAYLSRPGGQLVFGAEVAGPEPSAAPPVPAYDFHCFRSNRMQLWA